MALVPISLQRPEFKHITYTKPDSLEARISAGHVFMDGPLTEIPTTPLLLTPRVYSAFMKWYSREAFEYLQAADIPLLKEGDELFFVQIHGTDTLPYLAMPLSFRAFSDKNVHFRSHRTDMIISRDTFDEYAASGSMCARRGLHETINLRDEDRRLLLRRQLPKFSAAPHVNTADLQDWVTPGSRLSKESLVVVPKGLAFATSLEDLQSVRGGRIYVVVSADEDTENMVGLALNVDRAPLSRIGEGPISLTSEPPGKLLRTVPLFVLSSTPEFMQWLITNGRVLVDPIKFHGTFEVNGRFRYLEPAGK
jgi:hypothetical protein